MSITAAQVVAAFNNIKNIIEQLPKVQKESVDAAKQAADEQVKASLKDSGYVSPKIIASNIKANVNKDLVAAASKKPTEKGTPPPETGQAPSTQGGVAAASKKPTEKGTPPPETGQAPSTQGGTRAKTYKRRGTRRKNESKK